MSNFTKLMQQAAAGNAGDDFYPYTVDYSLLSPSGGNPLYRAQSSGSQTTWTYSCWQKGEVAGYLLLAGVGSPYPYTRVRINSGGNMSFTNYPYPGEYTVNSADVFRDYSAWYHFVIVADTTNATSSDRYRMYVNGQRMQIASSAATSTATTYVNASGYNIWLGGTGYNESTSKYMAQCCLIDGQALDPTSFAEDNNGVWVPKDLSELTFGTNGFWLDFSNSAALGTDVSGNGNHFTTSGLASSDQMLDTPTSNFCTMNPLDPEGASNTLSEGNLGVYINSQGTSEEGGATFAFESGKWYWETYLLSTNGSNLSNVYVGIKDPNGSDYWMVRGNGGEAEHNGTQTTISGLSWGSVGDIIGVAVDADAGTWTVSVNGTWISGNVHTNLSGLLTPFNANGNSANQHNIRVNFGQDSTFAGNTTAGGNTDANGNGDFKYAVPSGHLALCTANLPEPTIGPNSDTLSGENFNTVLYTGTGATRSITGVGFQPDLVWIKGRNYASAHWLHDVIRGIGSLISTSVSNIYSGSTNSVTSFDSDGFSLGNEIAHNGSGYNFVGWNWKAGGSGVSNTDGSITSTVSVNQDAGFSIVGWTSTATATDTVGHGLGTTPQIYIWKRYSSTSDWYFITDIVDGSWDYLKLNLNSAKVNADDVPATSTTIKNFTGTAGGSIIAYCFAEVDGFSSFGKYTGNGSSDGPFVYTGFRPAFVMIKRTDVTNNWVVTDSARSLYNSGDYALYPDLTNAESTIANYTNFHANGFKIRTTGTGYNASGGTYIYMAFAETPFKYANAR